LVISAKGSYTYYDLTGSKKVAVVTVARRWYFFLLKKRMITVA
jgi:hypothetical protein